MYYNLITCRHTINDGDLSDRGQPWLTAFQQIADYWVDAGGGLVGRRGRLPSADPRGCRTRLRSSLRATSASRARN